MQRRILALLFGVGCLATAPLQYAAATTLVYWSDSDASALWRANADGTGAAVLLPLSPGAEPRGIAIDAEAGFLYWAENGTNRIRRAGLDGASPEDVISSGLGFPADIEIDAEAGKLYWADRDLDVIRRANLDGAGVETVIGVPASGNNAAPYFLELDPTAGKLYWSDFDSGVIHRANLDGSSSENFITGLDRVRDIAILDDMIYWTDRDDRLVQRQRLDGTGRETLHGPTGFTLPHGLAIDPAAGLLFVADADGAQVVRGALDGAGDVAPLATTGLQNPWDVDLFIAPPSPASADFDLDGDVDGQDFLTWQRGLSTDDATRSHGDANGDGIVDALDLHVWRAQFGRTPAAVPIPEPTAPILCLIAAVAAPTPLRRMGRRAATKAEKLRAMFMRPAAAAVV